MATTTLRRARPAIITTMKISVLLLLATFFQLFFWGMRFRRLAAKTPSPPPGGLSRPLSIIICARNEAARLDERLPAVLEQAYPEFEVLVVDHASTDRTQAVLNTWTARCSRLRVLRCDDPGPGKKTPLALGIREARHDWIVLTDADCRPAGPNWLELVASGMDPGADLILGYGPLEKCPGFLNAFARYETVLSAIQYFSYALAGRPYMGVGRNLAYRKSALPSQPFSNHSDLLSGDDDLLVNAIAQKGNTRIILDPQSFTWSPAPDSWSAFFRRKSRHLSAGRRYKLVDQLWLGAWALSFLGFYALVILALLDGNWPLALSVYALRMVVVFLVFHPLSRKLQAEDLRAWLPLLDFFLFCYYLLMIPAVWGGKRQKWG